MVEPAIELVKHPGRDARPLEQPAGGEHQIVVIEPRPRRLVAVVFVEQRAAEAQQRGGRARHGHGPASLDDVSQARLLGSQRVCGVRTGRLHLLGEQPRARLERLGHENSEVVAEGGLALGGRRREPAGDVVAARDVRVAAVLERGTGGGQRRAVERAVGAGCGRHAFDRFVRLDAEQAPRRVDQAVDVAVVVEHRAQAAPRAAQRVHQVVEGVFVDVAGNLGERFGKPGFDTRVGGDQHGRLGVAQQLGRATLVEHLEMRREPGLERKAAEQRLTEGMDGHDLEAARRVEHGGEQPARAAPRLVVGQRPGQRLELGVEHRVVDQRPAPEVAVDAVGHLGGGGAREGQAQQPRGRRAVEQQAHHPVGQHLGLAGAGRRRDPDRLRRVGGVALRAAGPPARQGNSRAPRHHVSSPRAGSDHSLTRARCS